MIAISLFFSIPIPYIFVAVSEGTTDVIHLGVGTFALAGVGLAAYLYLFNPNKATELKQKFGFFVKILENKYYFDDFNNKVFAAGSRALGKGLFNFGDRLIIDGLIVNGSAKLVGKIALKIRNIQTGFMYHYAFAMILGLLVMLSWIIFKSL